MSEQKIGGDIDLGGGYVAELRGPDEHRGACNYAIRHKTGGLHMADICELAMIERIARLQEQVAALQATAVRAYAEGRADEASSAAGLRALNGSLQAQVDALRHERDRARASTDNAVKLLVSIHSLLYPAPIALEDGRTMVFRPKSPDPHQVLQELSDRIRALPDELAALAGAGR